MKILCLCDQGNNRSVQFAHLLKYWGNDCLPAGLSTNSQDTLDMLYKWADKIVITESTQLMRFTGSIDSIKDKILLLDVGPDTYPRPFNPELLAKTKKLLENNKSILKN